MKIKTSGKAHYIKVEPCESVVVEFCPDGVNEPIMGGHTVELLIGTHLTPGGKIALTLSLPKDKVYRVPDNKLVLFLHDLEGYEKLVFKQGSDVDEVVELERYG